MATPSNKQHLPIFVGSTFEDLKDHRKAVRDALHRLETIVRGMEYFGSRPGSPLEECLAVVRSCRIYIGIFAMRYGSVPDGHDLSMTHLEYEEARRANLPSLIYLIDEEHHPVLPRFVEMEPGAGKLRRLKERLRKSHTVSVFTTPEDLATRIIQDVPALVAEIGASISGKLPTDVDDDPESALRRFAILPRRFVGRRVFVRFKAPSKWHRLDAEDCEALGFTAGETVKNYVVIGGGRFTIFATGELAERLVSIAKGAEMRVDAAFVHGVRKTLVWVEDDPIYNFEELYGLHVKHFHAES